MSAAVLSVGSNLGDRYAHLRGAVTLLARWSVRASPVYETPPWGDPDQPDYLNAVLLVTDPAAGPEDWLRRARECEEAAGRVRDPDRRFGPRTLDVDVVAVWRADGSAVFRDDPELTLPHPRAAERAFVLRPWLDLDPAAVLPGHGPVADLPAVAATDTTGTLRLRSGWRLESDR